MIKCSLKFYKLALIKDKYQYIDKLLGIRIKIKWYRCCLPTVIMTVIMKFHV